jgi:hypothetical protein
MAVIIQIRRGTAAQWTTANPILADGEMGYEKDTSKFKFGDGTTAWSTLDYIETGGGDAHFLGKYISLAALETAHATAADGDYAIVDAGPGTDAKIYIWDADEGWVEGGGTGASTFADLTGSPTDNAALASALNARQPIDTDLTAIAALTPTNNDFMQYKSGAWANRTPAQAKTDLSLAKGDVGLGNVDNTSDADKPVSTAQGVAISAAQAAAISSSNGYTDTQISTEVTNRNNAITDALAAIKWKTSVRAATTANITLSGTQTIDGVALTAGQRVLVKDQTTQTQNGIYVVAAGAWARATDADTAAELQAAVVTVEEGTTNENTTWRQNTDNITIGSSNIVWSSFGVAVPDASETVKGIAEISTDAEAFTTADNLIMTPLKIRNRIRTKTTGTTSFSIDSNNDQRTVQVSPPGAIVCTVNSAAEDVIVQILNFGAGSVGFTAGIGVTITGIATLTSNKGAVVRYTSATTAVIIGGSTITFANITSKPTTVAGYGITDASRAIFSSGTTVNSVGTTETTLGTGNIPANTLATDLSHLRAVFVGTIGASGNNKTLKVKLGATTIYDSGAIPIAGAVSFEFQIKIMRTASNAQRGSVTLYSNSGTVAGMVYFTATEDLTTTLALAVTGTVASPGGTEITGNMFYAVKEGI